MNENIAHRSRGGHTPRQEVDLRRQQVMKNILKGIENGGCDDIDVDEIITIMGRLVKKGNIPEWDSMDIGSRERY